MFNKYLFWVLFGYLELSWLETVLTWPRAVARTSPSGARPAIILAILLRYAQRAAEIFEDFCTFSLNFPNLKQNHWFLPIFCIKWEGAVLPNPPLGGEQVLPVLPNPPSGGASAPPLATGLTWPISIHHILERLLKISTTNSLIKH